MQTVIEFFSVWGVGDLQLSRKQGPGKLADSLQKKMTFHILIWFVLMISEFLPLFTCNPKGYHFDQTTLDLDEKNSPFKENC